MKTIERLAKTTQFFIFIIVAAICLNTAYGQDSTNSTATKESTVKNIVDAQSYVFVAQSVSPMNGRTRQLTSYYDLEVSKDTIVSALPILDVRTLLLLIPLKAVLILLQQILNIQQKEEKREAGIL